MVQTKGLWDEPKLHYAPSALLDGLTVKRVPLFYPLYKRSFRLLGRDFRPSNTFFILVKIPSPHVRIDQEAQC